MLFQRASSVSAVARRALSAFHRSLRPSSNPRGLSRLGTILLAAGVAAATAASISMLERTDRRSPSSSVNAREKPLVLTPEHQLPVIRPLSLTFAPNMPPPITRRHQAKIAVDVTASRKVLPLGVGYQKFEFWTFEGAVPGPVFRARVGDVLEVNFTNKDDTGMEYNIDLHCVSGPGGGAAVLTAAFEETTKGSFRLLHPGFFFYHCSVAPLGVHIGKGMYGAILVEPEDGLPPVDKEFYIMQSEIYACEPQPLVSKSAASNESDSDDDDDDGADDEDPNLVDDDFEAGLNETPRLVVFNGRDGALRDEGALDVIKDSRVRLFVANAGPNLTSAFHVIGGVFDKVYREGDLVSPPGRSVSTTAIPPGGTAVAELDTPVPGVLTLVDHSIFRTEKGCTGFINVEGEPNHEIYYSPKPPRSCFGCTHHP